MKIDIVPLVVLLFCMGVALSALLSSEIFSQAEESRTVAQTQK